jgi:NAD+ kinase
MKVAIYSRGVDIDQQQSLQALLLALDNYAVKIYVYKELLEKFNLQASAGKEPLIAFNSFSAIDDSIDCLISLGGDGTVLDAVTIVGDSQIPILGINYGRLGFLATISKDELSIMVEALVNRTYVIEKRTLLHLDADPIIFGTAPYALNEFAIHKRDTSPMIKIHTYLNGEFLNSYCCLLYTSDAADDIL